MVRLLLSRPFLHQGSSQAILMTEHSIVFVWVLSLQGGTWLTFVQVLMFLTREKKATILMRFAPYKVRPQSLVCKQLLGTTTRSFAT